MYCSLNRLILQFIMEWLRRRKRDMESELYISVIEFITGNVKRSDLKYFQVTFFKKQLKIKFLLFFF